METPLYLRSKPAAFASSCDAVLVVQRVEFAVHMDVLSCHCGFFASLFEDFGPSGGFTPTPVPKSSKVSGLLKSEKAPLLALDSGVGVKLSYLTPSNFETFLHHIYNPTKAQVQSWEQANVLLELAAFFDTSIYMYAVDTYLTNWVRTVKPLDKPMPRIAEAVNSAELQKYLKCADRFKLRKLMAECLPYAMHDMFYRKNVACLLPHLDPVVADIFFSKLLELCTATAKDSTQTYCGSCSQYRGVGSCLAVSINVPVPNLGGNCVCASTSRGAAGTPPQLLPPAVEFKRKLEQKGWGY